jgi:hypothetical protein
MNKLRMFCCFLGGVLVKAGLDFGAVPVVLIGVVLTLSALVPPERLFGGNT